MMYQALRGVLQWPSDVGINLQKETIIESDVFISISEYIDGEQKGNVNQ